MVSTGDGPRGRARTGKRLKDSIDRTGIFLRVKAREAFAGRGKNDFPASRDLEDLIAVVDGRAELVGEIQAAADDVRSYLAKKIKNMISISKFNDALPGHLSPDAASQERVGTILSRLGAQAVFACVADDV
ncbi:MAG: hypothetical protein WAK48_05275 [Candidatus Acidiferrum sp.]|jgi:hypothetical protein